MKNYITILTILSLLNFGVPTLSMQQEDLEESSTEQNILQADLIDGLPNEVWGIILPFTYLDSNILDKTKAEDIYSGLSTVKQILSLYSKNIRLTCRTFNLINNVSSLKEKLRKFYRIVLSEKFLEQREGGLYPKNGEWGIGSGTDLKIASFMLAENKMGVPILDDAICVFVEEDIEPLREKIIALLLFYGADVNTTKNETTALMAAIFIHKREIVATLLVHGADVKGLYGSAALNLAISLHDNEKNYKEIIAMLLAHGVDVNITDNDGWNALKIALLLHNDANNDKDIIEMLIAHVADVKDLCGQLLAFPVK